MYSSGDVSLGFMVLQNERYLCCSGSIIDQLRSYKNFVELKLHSSKNLKLNQAQSDSNSFKPELILVCISQ
jgi:hypothetical protein